jgi:predicted ATPase/class 3 adenylate cyclase
MVLRTMSALPAGTVTFLFTDVEGSTKLLHELGAEPYADALAEHRKLVREVCAMQGGVEVDTQGDAFFLAFPTAPGALAAARAITEGLASGPIRVRIGLHTGTPLLTEEGYVGPDVHRAARLAAAGHGGQVLVSAATAALIEPSGSEPRALPLRDLGEHRFKDLAAPERVYQLADGEFPALKSLYRTNLPVPATPFLGRERELAEVGELLSRDDLRLLTLAGPGGTGKTRLALQAAAEVAERFPDGLWWVPLAPLRDASLLVPAVAQTLEIKEEPGKPVADTLARALAGKQTLVLLDNVEHLLPAAAHELARLASVSGPVLLVTSRERLQLQGEHLYPVPTLEERDAVELFLTRARALAPHFSANAAVSALCSRLDNLPLALELAAARTVVFTPEQLLERVSARLDLLKGGRDTDPRQQTLRATIEWSYDLLGEEEQRLFGALSVFVGGCTFEAAEDVCGAEPDTLQSLLDKSLLRRNDRGEGPRYWMLETIREFAQERVEDVAELLRLHAAYYLALGEQAESELRTGNQAAWLSKLDAEHENLRAALSFLRDSGAAVEMLRLAAALYRFWFYRGFLHEGRRWLDEALACGGADNAPARAKALAAAAQLAYRQAAYAESASLNEAALSAYRTLGDRVGVGRVLNQLADVAEAEGDLDRAEKLWTKSVAMARRSGDRYELGVAISNLGSLMLTRGDYERASPLTSEGLAIFEEIGNRHGAAVALENLGCAAVWEGRYRDAVPLLKESLVRFRELRTPVYAAHALDELAVVAALNEQAVTATRLLGAVDRILAETGGALAPDTQELQARALAAIRERLDESAFELAHAEGGEKTLDEAIEYALESVDA